MSRVAARLSAAAGALALFVPALASLPGAAAPLQTVGTDDLRLLAGVSDPAIAPDGKHVAAVVSRIHWDEDTSTNDLVSIDVATHAATTLLRDRKGLSAPAYSPDGTRLAFLAQGSGKHDQLFVMPAGGGHPRQISHAGEGIDEFAWRPDGRAFVYAATDAPPARHGADRFRDSFVFTTEPIVARSAPRPDHLFLLDAVAGKTTQLTFGTRSASAPSWSPNGTSIAFASAPNAIFNDQAYAQVSLLDVATKGVRALTTHGMWEGSPIFSPDGTKIAYLYSDGDPQIALTRLYVTTPHGGNGVLLAASLDRSIGDAVWSADSRSLIVTAPSGLTNALYRVRTGGRAQQIDLGDVTPGVPMTTTGGASTPSLHHALAADGTLAFIGAWTAQPPEVYTTSAAGTTTKRSNFNAAMLRFAWASAQRITFPTSTGVTADGVLYLPPGYRPGHEYPLVLYIHGGPSDPTQMTFDFWAQVMAARGWLVLRPNYRGSPNLGLAYQHAIFNDPEDGPGKDLLAALDVVRARGIVDDKRIAVCGWSYGGIMTSWMISKYHIWSSAVSGAPVNDWIADYGTADDSLGDRDLFHGSPFVGDNAAAWRAASAISYAADVTTPVLILSDVGDNRDPFATSSMYWRALRDNGKDATLRVWPVAGHVPNDPVRVADIYRYWIAFIARHFQVTAR